jgi:PPOX class probable F420-dependent enzyme
MQIADALAFLRLHQNGVLATAKRDGRPQLSNITYSVADDEVVEISITADRAKFVNLSRVPQASLHVTRDDFWAYAVVEGDVELLPVAERPDDATVEALVALYRRVRGEHPDWDEYRAVMVKDRRTVVRLRPAHAYGMLPA